VPAPPSDGRERERNLVERARPRSQGPEGARGRRGANNLLPRAREDGAVRTTCYRGRERTAQSAHSRPGGASDRPGGARRKSETAPGECPRRECG
jgi:hypothetical protein